jgi:hypothetical protein
MSARGHIMTWGSPVGTPTQEAKWHWFQRIRQWVANRTARRSEAALLTLYGSWDAQHERFRPLTAESALEQAATQGGQTWYITMHGAAL